MLGVPVVGGGALHRLFGRLGLWHVVQAERDAISLQEPVGVGVMPGRVAELDRVIATARQQRQERFEPREVSAPAGRHLVEHRAHVILEVRGARPQMLDRSGRLIEASPMRQVLARLDRVAESVRRALAPSVKGLRLRQAIEGPVELDRVEPRRVMLQPSGLREIRGIEGSAPVSVLPA